MVSLPSPPTPTSPPPTEAPAAHALGALSDQDNRWLDSYTSSICDFDPVRLRKETNQPISAILTWLDQPHIQAALKLFDKAAGEGFFRRATASISS